MASQQRIAPVTPDVNSSAIYGWERFGKRIAILFVLIFGLARAWVERFSLDADGISYLDLSDAFTRRDWHNFLNAYWSPLYPILLGISRLVLPTSKRWELPSAHLLNFAIYAAALGCFEYFYAALRDSLVLRNASRDQSEEQSTFALIGEWPLWVLAHALFLWVSLDLITLWDVTPDMCVSALVYVIAGLILRFRQDSSWRRAAALGVVLGVSYWAKAVMFPLAFVFMAIALLRAPNVKTAVKRGLVMAAIFAAVAGPLVAALSIQKHRLTFGDSGPLAYANLVSPGGASHDWQGEPALGIKAVHPVRKLLSDPPLYEFAQPIGGTYPPFFDPTYWEEGRVARFSLRAQVATIGRHLLLYAELLLHQNNALVATVLTFLFVMGRGARRALSQNLPLFCMCGAALGLYMLVLAEYRYIGAYVAILWLGLLSPFRAPTHLRVMSGCLSCAVALVLLITVADSTARSVREGGPYSAAQDIVVSDHLDAMGLHPGDRIGIVGGVGGYAARLSHAKVVAEVWDVPAFWRLSQEKRQAVLLKFAETGAKMVLAPDPGPLLTPDSSWLKVDAQPLYLHMLQGP
jgi:hypothetical protein